MFYTNDNGNSWQNTTVVGTLSGASAIDQNNVVFIGESGVITVTRDGGISFTQIPPLVNQTILLRAVGFPSSNIGYIVGDDSTFIKTADGGNTWTLYDASPSFLPTDIYALSFPTTDTGFVAGLNGGFSKTTDGGKSFTKTILSNGTPPANNTTFAMYFNNTKLGYLVGTNYTILKTTDGGKTWVDKSTGGGSGAYYAIITPAIVN